MTTTFVLAPSFTLPAHLLPVLAELRPTAPGQLIPCRFERMGQMRAARGELRDALAVAGAVHHWMEYRNVAADMLGTIARFDRVQNAQGSPMHLLWTATNMTWRVKLALFCELYRARLAPFTVA